MLSAAWRAWCLAFGIALATLPSGSARAQGPAAGDDPGLVKLRHADFMMEQGQFPDALAAYREAEWFFTEGSDGLKRARAGQEKARAAARRGGDRPVPPGPGAREPESAAPRTAPAGESARGSAAVALRGADPTPPSPGPRAGALDPGVGREEPSARAEEESRAGTTAEVGSGGAAPVRAPDPPPGGTDPGVEPPPVAAVAVATASEAEGGSPGRAIPIAGLVLGALAAAVLTGWSASRSASWLGRVGSWARRRGLAAVATPALDRAARLQPGDAELAVERARLRAEAGDTGEDAAGLYKEVLARGAPEDLVARLASLYKSADAGAPAAREMVEALAAVSPGDADLWEVLEARLGRDDDAGRVAIARHLDSLGRGSPERLLRMAWHEARAGRFGDEARDLYRRALSAGDAAASGRGAGPLLALLVPLYLAHDVEDPETAEVLQAALAGLVEGMRDADGFARFGGPLRHWGLEAARALGRRLPGPAGAARAFEAVGALLGRFRGEPDLVGVLVAAGLRAGRVNEALATVRASYPIDGVDAGTTAAVARALVAAAGEAAPEGASDAPGALRVLAAARDYLASLGGDEARRPDVRELLTATEACCSSAGVRLPELDAELADRFWTLGDYPTAVAIFLRAAGLRVDARAVPMKVYGTGAFPEPLSADRGTVVQIVADRGPSLSEILSLSSRVGADPACNPGAAFVVGRIPEGREVVGAVFRLVEAGKTPVIPLTWDDLWAGLSEGRAGDLLARHLRRWLSRDDQFQESEPASDAAAWYARPPMLDELSLTLAEPGAAVGLFGLRRVGKTSLALHLARELRASAVAWVDLARRGGPGSLGEAWRGALAGLAEDAWRKGIAPASTRGTAPPATRVDDPEGLLASLAEARRALADHGPEPHVVLVVDGLDAGLPDDDPFGGSPADGWPGLPVLLDAAARLVAEGQAALLVVSRRDSVATEDRLGGRPNPLKGRLLARHLPPLDEAACGELVLGIGTAMGMGFEPAALRAVYELSGGHPFLARQVGSLLVQQHPARPVLLGPRDVERAGEGWQGNRERREELLALISDLPDACRGVLKAVARTSPDPCSRSQVRALLADRFKAAEADRGVRALVATGLLVERDGGLHLTVGLLRDWLQRTLRRADEETAMREASMGPGGGP